MKVEPITESEHSRKSTFMKDQNFNFEQRSRWYLLKMAIIIAPISHALFTVSLWQSSSLSLKLDGSVIMQEVMLPLPRLDGKRPLTWSPELPLKLSPRYEASTLWGSLHNQSVERWAWRGPPDDSPGWDLSPHPAPTWYHVHRPSGKWTVQPQMSREKPSWIKPAQTADSWAKEMTVV